MYSLVCGLDLGTAIPFGDKNATKYLLTLDFQITKLTHLVKVFVHGKVIQNLTRLQMRYDVK